MIELTPLMGALAAGGDRGRKLADVICDLVVKGGQLGELHGYPYRDGAEWKTGKRLPREWLKRLVAAVETGAIDDMPASKIVEILLLGKSGT